MKFLSVLTAHLYGMGSDNKYVTNILAYPGFLGNPPGTDNFPLRIRYVGHHNRL